MVGFSGHAYVESEEKGRNTIAGRLAGKSGLITGAGQGIGRAAALRFAVEGAQVCGLPISIWMLSMP